MKYCIEVSNGLWAFVLLLGGLSGLLLLGIGAVALMERRTAHKRRLVRVKGATRVGPQRLARHTAPAANDPDHHSWDQ
jgi:hypothetical protein